MPSRWTMGVDESGEPVAGAEVEVRLGDDPARPRGDGTPRNVLTKTKDDGSFELRPLAAGAFTLQAHGPGFAPAYVAGVEIPAAARVEHSRRLPTIARFSSRS